MWWSIVLAFWKLPAFWNAPIRDVFFRFILLLSHYLVNGSFLFTDSTAWRKEKLWAVNRRPFSLCPVDVGTEAWGAAAAGWRENRSPFCLKSCKDGCSWVEGSQRSHYCGWKSVKWGGLIIWSLLWLVGSTAALSQRSSFQISNL